jgi:hypothetical protein
MTLREAHISKLENRYAISNKVARRLAEQGVLASVNREEAARLLNFEGLESGGILVRYPSAPDAFTIRLDTPCRGKDGKERKYLRPPGQVNRLFVPPGVDAKAREEEIWITEGELKALAGAARGLPVCGLAGVWNWRTDTSAEDPAAAAAKLAGGGRTGAIPDGQALIEDLRRDWASKRFVLLYDSDITQEHPAWPAFGRLAEQLYARGAAQVKIVTLPRVIPEGKTGLDDYIRMREEQGGDPIAELRELAARAPEWLPVADGAERYARARLASADLEAVARGAAALLAVVRSDPVVQQALKESGVKYEFRRGLLKRAKEILREALARQEHRPEGDEKKAATVGEMLPDAPAEALNLTVPEGWVLKQDGLYRLEAEEKEGGIIEEKEERITAVPLLLVSKKKDIDTRRERFEEIAVLSANGGGWERSVVESSAVFDTSKAVRTLREQLNVLGCSSTNVGQVVRYLTEFEKANAAAIKRDLVTYTCGYKQLEDGSEIFVAGKRIITPSGSVAAAGAAEGAKRDAELLEFVGLSPGEEQLAEALAARKGTLQGWFNEVLAPVAHLDAVRMAVYLALAPPVMRYTRTPNFVFNFSGLPGTGKTICGRIAVSAWGDPGDEGLVLSWDSTKVGLERAAAFFKNIVMFRDDTNKAKKPQDVGHFIYEFSGGREKGRGAPEGLRAAGTWQTILLSTGEDPIYSFLAAGQGGARRRVVEYAGTCIPDERLQKRVVYALWRHHGHAAEEFVRYLLNLPKAEKESLMDEAARLDHDVFLPLLAANGLKVDSFTATYSVYFALLALAASLVHDALPGLPWSEKEGSETLKRVFLETCRRAEAQYAHMLALEYVRSWAAANARNFFGHPEYDEERPPSEGLGRWAEGDFVAVYPHRLMRVLRDAGVTYEGTLERWADEGWIEVETVGKKKRYDVKVRMAGDLRPRLVKIRWSALFSDLGATL